MSDQSNINGRAYEYACLHTLHQEIRSHRPAEIIENSSYEAAGHAWNLTDEKTRSLLLVSARAAIKTLFELEPLIIEDGQDILELYIQPDYKGEAGDVRDIIIARRDIHWEIGLSIKHNHFAVKHSRLSRQLDFGERWFGIPCSNQYWSDISPIFNYLSSEQSKGRKWRELPLKAEEVYIPLLNAFVSEINRANSAHKGVPQRIVEYLLGEFDFYKVISIDSSNITRIQSYNLRGTLNKPSAKSRPKITVPKASLPTRIVSLGFKPGSNNTVELYMDGGWQFSFRIHNASAFVEPSLKFDVQIIGMPSAIISINCLWH